MKVEYEPTVESAMFNDLAPGTLFRDEDNDGLFVKIDDEKAVIIDPLAGPVSYGSVLPAGHISPWSDGRVCLVSGITVHQRRR